MRGMFPRCEQQVLGRGCDGGDVGGCGCVPVGGIRETVGAWEPQSNVWCRVAVCHAGVHSVSNGEAASTAPSDSKEGRRLLCAPMIVTSEYVLG